MTAEADQLARLRLIWPEAEVWNEGGQPAVFIPGLEVLVRGAIAIRDALLWPRQDGGYSSRLYLSQPVGAGQNWNAATKCGRTWHACSWNEVPANMPWDEMVLSHLGAFK